MANPIITQEELDKLLELTNNAQKTPVMALSVADGLAGRDFASQAWGWVRSYWQELGKKYNFNPELVKGIDCETREVCL